MKTQAVKAFMAKAIQSAESGIERGEGGPFGAVIVQKNKILAVAHNTVLKNQDATCHSEMNAIRLASRKIRSFDLRNCVIFSTTEPCPMCFSAIHWSGIEKVIFGTRIADVQKRGFRELTIPASKMKRMGKSQVKIRPGFMREECLELLKQWDGLEKKKVY